MLIILFSAKSPSISSTNPSIRLVSCTDQITVPEQPIKISISSPGNLNSPQQYVNMPHVFTQPTELLHPPLPNPYAPNICCENIEENQCIHSDCHISNSNNSNNIGIDGGNFAMNINTMNPPSIHTENKNDPSLAPDNNIYLDTLGNHHLSLQNVTKPNTHNQPPPLLTTLLPPSTSLSTNDVVMTSSPTFSLLRSVSPVHLLTGSLNTSNTSHIHRDGMDCTDEDRKPYLCASYNPLRDDSVAMTTLENAQCSTLLF